jgi:hypothetical protein
MLYWLKHRKTVIIKNEIVLDEVFLKLIRQKVVNNVNFLNLTCIKELERTANLYSIVWHVKKVRFSFFKKRCIT